MLETLIKEGGVKALQEHLTKEQKEIDNTPLKIAVIGACKAGKSSFINLMRGLGPDDDDSAEIGIMQTTSKVTAYPHPNHPNFVLYDLPGVGTKEFPKEKYLNAVNFNIYDFYLLIFKDVVTENDIWLAREMTRKKKELYVIRTHIDIAVADAKRRKNFNEGTVLGGIRKEIEKDMEGVHLYLISNYEANKWDYPSFLDDLVAATPGLKQKAIIMIVSAKTRNIIEKKTKVLRSRIKYLSLISAAANASPIPGTSLAVDLPLLLQTVQEYKVELGVIDADVSADSNLGMQIKEGLLTALKTASIGVAKEVVEEGVLSTVKLAIPIIGSAIAAAVSFSTTYYTLSTKLTETKEEALKRID